MSESHLHQFKAVILVCMSIRGSWRTCRKSTQDNMHTANKTNKHCWSIKIQVLKTLFSSSTDRWYHQVFHVLYYCNKLQVFWKTHKSMIGKAVLFGASGCHHRTVTVSFSSASIHPLFIPLIQANPSWHRVRLGCTHTQVPFSSAPVCGSFERVEVAAHIAPRHLQQPHTGFMKCVWLFYCFRVVQSFEE